MQPQPVRLDTAGAVATISLHRPHCRNAVDGPTGVHALLGQRAAWQRLVDQPAMVNSAVEELLRFESPLQLNNRQLGSPLTLGDITLPAGDFITPGVGAANHDPAQVHQPTVLDLALGHGAHACAGMNVARLEARIALGCCRRHPAVNRWLALALWHRPW